MEKNNGKKRGIRRKGRLRGSLGILLASAVLFHTLPAGGLAVYASNGETEPCEYHAESRSGQIKVDVGGQCVFAQGTPIVIQQNGSITSIYDEDGILLSGETDVSTYQIYGGWFGEAGRGDPSIVMKSGTVDTIYGGSFAGELTGGPAITVKGGTVKYLYGGGSLGSTQGSTNITIEGGTITQLYGGGYSSPQTGDASIAVKGGSILGQINGGGKNSSVGNAHFEVSLASQSQTVTLDGSSVAGSCAARFFGRKASGQYGAAVLTDIDEVTAEDCKLILWGHPGSGSVLDLERLEIPVTGEVVFPVENQSVTIGELAGQGAVIFQYNGRLPQPIQVDTISSSAAAPIKLKVEGTSNDSDWTGVPWFQGDGVKVQDSESCFICSMDGYIPQKTDDGAGIQLVKGDSREQAYLSDVYFSQADYRYGDTMTITMKLADSMNQGIPNATVEVRGGSNDLQAIASAVTGQDGCVTFTLPVDDHLWQSKEYGLQAAFWGNSQYKQNFYGISLKGGNGNMSFAVGRASIVLSGIIPAPVPDAAPAAGLTVSSTAFYTAQLVWSPADPVFRLDQAYTAGIRLIPKPGFSLDSEKVESITWNGREMTLPAPEADGSLLLRDAASFAAIPGRDIALIPSHAEGGTVAGGGRYPEGAQVTVTAFANAGFHFVRWTENGVQVSTSANYTFTVTGGRTLSAVFEKDSDPAPSAKYTVTVQAGTGGTASGGGTYAENESVTVTAAADSGYKFVKWTENGREVSANADYTFTVTGSRTLAAVFEKNSSPGTGSGGSGSSGNTGSGSFGGSGSTGTKQPFLKDSSGRKGWDVIRAAAEIAAADPAGGKVAVDMNGTVSVPGSIFAAIWGKDVTLCFDMGGGITWSVNGKDITADNVNDMDFSVKADAGAIPKELTAETAGGLAHLELSPAHEGAFGFTAVLTLRIVSRDGNGITVSSSGTAAGYTGMYANLFYYNPALRSLEFICAGQIGEDGTADLPLVHASDYTVILSAAPMGSTGTPDEPQEPDEAEKPQEPVKQAGVKSVKLSKTMYTYTGKAKRPSVAAVDTEGRKISSRYYTVSYKNNKKAGKATVTVKFKGVYSGTVKKMFTIRPAGTSIQKLTAASGGFAVKWKKKTAQTSGYQIQYSADAGFKGSSTHSVFVKKNSTVKKAVKKLKAGRKYYVRIRTYKAVKTDGKSTQIYSAWSKAGTVKTL